MYGELMGTEQRDRPANARQTTSESKAGTMRAIVQDVYGEAQDVLRLEHIARPEIADDELLLEVHAAGVDRGVWHLMAGLPYPIRLMGYGFRAPKDRALGRDVAGVVKAVGTDVTTFAPGDEVFGVGEGSFAEFCRAKAAKVALKPKNLTFEQAAAVPISGLTALQAVRDAGQVRSGQSVLIIGASGGVGTFAVQIAKAFGAHVTGVCSTPKVDLVRSLGAEHVLDYTSEDITSGGRYDVVLDTGGHRSLSHLRRALTPHGTLVVVGSETGGRWLGGFDRSLRAPVLSMFVGQTLRALTNSENAADLVALTELIEAGEVIPAVERTYPLAETPAAIRHMAGGHARGKLVITI
jgi:NADPH:quinone reductase-like Zn-dependent oxidoreductase